MNVKNINPKIRQISVDNGYIHKIGTDTYFKQCVMLPNDTLDMYEEVDEIPPYTKAEYDKKVAEFVRERYSDSEEFAIQRKMINAMLSPATISEDIADKTAMEYADYNNYVEECKERAKDPELYNTEITYVTDDIEITDLEQEITD